jgi:hypothetical protein
MTQASAGAMHWSKPSENRFYERFAKAIGLSEVLVEPQLAWASRGRRWHTRCKSWGSLALHNKSDPTPVKLLVSGKRRPMIFMRVSVCKKWNKKPPRTLFKKAD